MIIKAFKYKSGKKGAQRLNRHLWKQEDQRVEWSETRNLYVRDTEAGMRVMRCLKEGSQAEIVFWHIVISPRTKLNEIDRKRVVDLVIAELRADTHPLMVLSHLDKLRARPGGAAGHLHLVLGHVCPITFRALDMRNHLQRLRKVMAIAAFEIEGTIALGPFHGGIAAYLIKEGRGDVAAWLTDLAATAPPPRRPRMTDAMRRAAAAVGFGLPSFQAQLERLWHAGAPEAEFTAFLSGAEVTVRRGDRSPHAVLFYHKGIQVGVLHHILRQPSLGVSEGAMQRYPDLCTGPWATAEAPKETSKTLATLRQEKTDKLEASLRGLRREMLDLTYTRAKSSHTVGDAARPTTDRIEKLTHAVAIFEGAIDLMWEDDSWISRPIEALLSHSKRLLTSPRIEDPDGASNEHEIDTGWRPGR